MSLSFSELQPVSCHGFHHSWKGYVVFLLGDLPLITLLWICAKESPNVSLAPTSRSGRFAFPSTAARHNG
jgi:hypothetical protein